MNLQLMSIEWIPGGVRVRVRDQDNDVDVRPIDVHPSDPAWKDKLTPQLQQSFNTARQGVLALVSDYLGSDTPVRAATAALEVVAKATADREQAEAAQAAAEKAKADAEAAQAAAEKATAAAEATRNQVEAEVDALLARKANLDAELADAPASPA